VISLSPRKASANVESFFALQCLFLLIFLGNLSLFFKTLNMSILAQIIFLKKQIQHRILLKKTRFLKVSH
jgi:hypothetical protein